MKTKYKSQDNLIINKNDEAYIIKYKDVLYYGNDVVVDVLNICKENYISLEDIIEKLSKEYNALKEEISDDISELVSDLNINEILKKED